MLYGAGSLIFLTKELADNPNSVRGEDLVYPGYLSTFELTAETNLLEAKALIDGKRQIVAAAINEETFTMKVSTEFVDWHAVQFGYDEIAQVSSNVKLPVVLAGKVPSTGPYTLADTGITSANLASVRVYIASPIPNRGRIFAKVVSAAPAAVDEVQVEAGTLTFHPSAAGATVQWSYEKNFTSVQSIGQEASYDQFGKLAFSGLCYGTEFPGKMQVIVPELSRVSTPSLSVAGDVTTLEIEFRASVPPGERRPFKLFNLGATA